jgi:hypothetical protein
LPTEDTDALDGRRPMSSNTGVDDKRDPKGRGRPMFIETVKRFI